MEIVIFDPQQPKFFQPDRYVGGKISETDKLQNLLEPNDIVFHLVHTTIPSDASDTAAAEKKENIEPSQKVISLLKNMRLHGLVYLSSGGTIYGEAENRKPIPETAPANPGSPYARAKLEIENAVQNSGTPYIIIRPGNPFGPFQEALNRHGAVGQIFLALAKNQPFTIYGQGDTARDYIYMDDFISALLLLLRGQKWNEIYNIGAGAPTSLSDLIALCEKISGKILKKNFLPIRATDLKFNALDVSKIKGMGWSLKFPLEQGLQKTWEYFKK